jgi:Icc-related predicted phosphoesterase
MHKLRPNVVRDRILTFAALAPGRRVIVVQGNHDNPDPRACNGRSLEIAGLIVGGVGGSLPTGGHFPFELEERDYETILQRLGRVDILVVHQPPYDTKCDLAYTGRHAGSKRVCEKLTFSPNIA